MFQNKLNISISIIIAIVAYATYEFYLKLEYSPTIETSNGKVVGFVSKSRIGKSYFSFLGIPYGLPPLGELRFQSPKPAEKWSGVRDALKFGSMCIHADVLSRKIVGDEDCLFLNVYVPKDGYNSGKLLPVIFYIHGGYFMVGSSNLMGPELLLDEMVIVVTVNYRINAFGFLNTEDSSAKGNAGLKDQNLALKWVYNNIQNFGGDGSKIAIAGQSAGSVATSLHTMSSMSQGLFSAVIMSSGTAIKPWSLVKNPKAQAENLGKLLNCPIEPSSVLVACLRKIDAKTIAKTYSNALTPLMDELEIFAPSVEKCIPNDNDCFLSAHPYDILIAGGAARVPILTGLNADEGNLVTARIFLNSSLEDYVVSHWNELSPSFFSYPQSRVDLTDKIRRFYVGDDGSQILPFKQKFQNITNAFSDRLYIHATRTTVKIQSQFSSPIYLYYFNYRPHRGVSYLFDVDHNLPILLQFAWKEIMWFLDEHILRRVHPFLGVGHGDDISLVFKFPVFDMSSNSKDFEKSRELVQMWADFVTDPMNMKLANKKWDPISKSDKNLKYMIISDCDKHGTILDEDEISSIKTRMNFWDEINLGWK